MTEVEYHVGLVQKHAVDLVNDDAGHCIVFHSRANNVELRIVSIEFGEQDVALETACFAIDNVHGTLFTAVAQLSHLFTGHTAWIALLARFVTIVRGLKIKHVKKGLVFIGISNGQYVRARHNVHTLAIERFNSCYCSHDY